jgi:FkbM family methyltransferase
MSIREAAKDAMKLALMRTGICVAKSKYSTIVSKERYGIDPWRDVERLARALKRSIEVCFDVGANVGDTSLVLLERFQKSRVFAFEPHPATFSKLAARTDDGRFFPQQFALGEERGESAFYVYDDEPAINSLAFNARYAARFKRATSEITVRVDTVDEFCSANEIQRIDVLKIDTEGFDLHVLKGARQMLANGLVEFVYVEFNDCLAKRGTTGGGLNEISEYLGQFKFHFVSTYTDYVVPADDLFVVSNLLMVKGV